MPGAFDSSYDAQLSCSFEQITMILVICIFSWAALMCFACSKIGARTTTHVFLLLDLVLLVLLPVPRPCRGHARGFACGCGRVGVWACERVGVWACGRVGVWACGRVGVWACGRVGVWACGRVGVWACGRAGVRAWGRGAWGCVAVAVVVAVAVGVAVWACGRGHGRGRACGRGRVLYSCGRGHGHGHGRGRGRGRMCCHQKAPEIHKMTNACALPTFSMPCVDVFEDPSDVIPSVH